MKFDRVGFNYDVNAEVLYYLVEIDNDRYGGAYSGAEYTAWSGPQPNDIDAGDGACEEFWNKHRETAVHGRGKTPRIAFEDLINKLSWDTDCIQVVRVDSMCYLLADFLKEHL